MIEVDVLIYKLAILGLLLSCVRRLGFLAAFLLCASFVFEEIVLIRTQPTWPELERWFFMIAAKDYIIALILGFRKRSLEILLSIIFMSSALFHLLAQIEVHNEILNLKHMRPTIMVYIITAQLATMYLIILNGSGHNGGKRVKYNLPVFNRHYDRFFYTKAFKVKQ